MSLGDANSMAESAGQTVQALISLPCLAQHLELLQYFTHTRQRKEKDGLCLSSALSEKVYVTIMHLCLRYYNACL